MNAIRSIGLVLAAWLLVAAEPATTDEPDTYMVRLPVTVTDQSAVQRLTLPVEALTASQEPNLADIRIFDRNGRPMPIARTASPVPRARRIILKALPILGADDRIDVRDVSLRFDPEGRPQVAEIVGAPAASGVDVRVAGVLLDARTVVGSVLSLSLDADVPVAQPVTFTVEASRDLTDWRSVAEKTIYRAGARGNGAALLDTNQAALSRDYLRITWRAASRLISPVTVYGATLSVSTAEGTNVSSLAASVALPSDPHVIDVAIPFATPIASLDIQPAGNDLLVPFRVLGRENREQPWRLLGSGVAAAGGGGRPAELSGDRASLLRIEADARTPGFTTSPSFRLGFVDQIIVFLPAGEPPFVLAAGKPDTPDLSLPLTSLSGGRVFAEATVVKASAPSPLRLVASDDHGSTRKLILWLSLTGATVLLAGMAWLLSRRAGNPIIRESPDEG